MDNLEQLEIPSLFEIEKYLKESGSYDPTMNEGEMMEMYQVLRNSENTACREDAERKILKRKEDSNHIQDYIKHSEPVKHDEFDEENNYIDFSPNEPSSSSNKENESDFIDMLDVEREPSSVKVVTDLTSNNIDFINVFDCAPSKHKQMKRVFANPEYEPPFYCSMSVTDKSIKERANMIYSYHLSLNRIYDNFQKESNYYATWGNTIKPSHYFNGNLLKREQKLAEVIDDLQINESTIQTNEDNVETYISKSGRQTKRKLYNENEYDYDDLDDDFCDSKKSKPHIAKKNPATEWHEKTKPLPNATDSNDTSSPVRKRKSINSSSNEELMKKSKLSTNTSTTSTSRSERLFDSLREQTQKRKEKEREIEKFTESLNSYDGNDDEQEADQEIDVAELVHIEEPFPRRRIVPPTFTNKKQGKSINQNKSNTIKEETSQESPSRSKYQPIESLTVTRSIAKKKGPCPLCNQEFVLSELETHASTCMESCSEPSEEIKMTGFYNNQMMCETCDMVLPLNSDYEVHVRECLNQRIRKDKSVL